MRNGLLGAAVALVVSIASWPIPGAAIAEASVCPEQQTSRVATSAGKIEAVWQEESGSLYEPSPDPQYPVLVSYEGCLSVGGAGPDVAGTDLLGGNHVFDLHDLSPAAREDAITWWAVRGTPIPVHTHLLNDAGVEFNVAGLNPFGTAARFGQGGISDPYFWGAVPAGSQLHPGNRTETMVVHGGMPVTFPDRPPSASPAEGHLEWEHAGTFRDVTSRAYDPTMSNYYSTDLVSQISYPFLKVVGGDLAAPATAQYDLVLPDDVKPFGAFGIFPSGLPGVHVDFGFFYPGLAERDFHLLRVEAGAEPVDPWPESTSVGPARQWMYRPLVVHYGHRRSRGAVSFSAPVPAGSEVLALSVDGTVERVRVDRPGVMSLLNVGGEQHLQVIEDPAPASAGPGEGEDPAPSDIASPELRGLLPQGTVSASLTEREGVPMIEDLVMGADRLGNVAMPYLVIDGEPVKLSSAILRGPPQVVPVGFADGNGFFYGSGFKVRMLAETRGMMIELEIAPLLTNFWAVTYLYVRDAHSTDGEEHTLELAWYSDPDADSFTAHDREVPFEAVVHPEYYYLEDRSIPDIEAIDSQTGQSMRYLPVEPTVLLTPEDGLRSNFALLSDPDAFTSDPAGEADGEMLGDEVVLYAIQRLTGLPGPFYHSLLFLIPS